MHQRCILRTTIIAVSLLAGSLGFAHAQTTALPPITPPVIAPAVQPVSVPQPIRYRLSDCHFHFVDFLQHTDGMSALLAALDRSGVDHVMLSGMPLVKQWSENEPLQPQYYLEDDARCYWYSATDMIIAHEVQALPPAQRARVHPFICGFNGADRNAVEHVQRMLDWYPGLWQGIGEIMARHDDLTALTYGETTHADNAALARIYDLAAAHDLPVWVHSNISSVWKREPIYMHEMETAVRDHPRTRFVWCHAGISRRIDVPTITQELRRLLTTYPNLSIDLSWVVFEQYMVKDKQPNPDWVALVEAFPTRFMIGSDKVGHFATYSDEMQKYYVFLDALKTDTARKVGRDNFLAALPNHGVPVADGSKR